MKATEPLTTTLDPLNEALLTPAEVAAICKVSSKTVLRAVREGKLAASRLGTRAAYRITPTAVIDWIKYTTVMPTPKLSAKQNLRTSKSASSIKHRYAQDPKITLKLD